MQSLFKHVNINLGSRTKDSQMYIAMYVPLYHRFLEPRYALAQMGAAEYETKTVIVFYSQLIKIIDFKTFFSWKCKINRLISEVK